MTQLRYEIRSIQRWSRGGVVGVWLFLTTPFLNALFCAWFFSSARGEGFFAGLLVLLSAFAFLAGCVLIVIGREQVHKIESY